MKIDCENGFNSINRQFLLEKTFETHPEVYKYSHSVYIQPSFLFYDDSVTSDFLTTIFSETFEDVSFIKALEKWLSLTNEQEGPLDGTQKSWTQPVFVKTAQDLISRRDYKRSKVFNTQQGKFGSHWLNVVPCKNLSLKLDDQHLGISIGLRLGAFCVSHTCHWDTVISSNA